MMYEVSDLRLAVTDGIKGSWEKVKAAAVVRDVNKMFAKDQLHLHFSNGADVICTAKSKVKIWVEVDEPSSST